MQEDPFLGYFLTDRQQNKEFFLYLIGKIAYIDFKRKLKGSGVGGFLNFGLQYKFLFLEIGEEILLLKDRKTGILASATALTYQIGIRLHLGDDKK